MKWTEVGYDDIVLTEDLYPLQLEYNYKINRHVSENGIISTYGGSKKYTQFVRQDVIETNTGGHAVWTWLYSTQNYSVGTWDCYPSAGTAIGAGTDTSITAQWIVPKIQDEYIGHDLMKITLLLARVI